MITILLLGLWVGAILGLTGAGGGILATPALMAGMGWTMQQSTPVALFAVAGSALLGALDGLRKKTVRYKAALLMALTGMPFTALGIHIAQSLPQRLLLVLFATVMLIVAGRQLHQSRLNRQGADDVPCPIHPDSGRFQWSWSTALILGSVGAGTGLMTGLLGVGGGFIIVPVLRKLTNLTMQSIVATSLMVIALVSGSGILSALIHGITLPLDIVSAFALATVTGMLIGRGLIARLSDQLIQRGFATVLIVVALGLLAKALLLA